MFLDLNQVLRGPPTSILCGTKVPIAASLEVHVNHAPAGEGVERDRGERGR